MLFRFAGWGLGRDSAITSDESKKTIRSILLSMRSCMNRDGFETEGLGARTNDGRTKTGRSTLDATVVLQYTTPHN